MSYLITMSKYVELSDNNIGLVVIKNAKIQPQNAAYPIAFKVKANMKQLIDVRPAFGVLIKDTQRQTITLHIKYSGKIEDIQKAKLQIIWSSIECNSNDDILNKKVSYNDFSQKLKTAKKIKQGSLVLPFQHQQIQKQPPSRQQSQGDISQANTQSVGEQSVNKAHTSIDTETQRQQLINNGKKVQQSQISIEIKENLIRKDENRLNEVPIKKVMVLILIFFTLGILFGIKIQKMLEQPCLSVEIKDQVAKIKQQKMISQAEQPQSNKIQQRIYVPNQL